MKIALCQLNFKVGDIKGNTNLILENISKSVAQHVDLIVFSELSICGYPPQDLLDYNHFIIECENAVQQILDHNFDIGIIIGTPMPSQLQKGKKLFNAALFIYKNTIIGQSNKTLLPTYNVFDEYRYFEPNDIFQLFEFKNHKIAITICEDLWENDEPFLYKTSPVEQIKNLNPDLVINLSASPFSYKHIEERKQLMINNAKYFETPLIYVNQVGGNTDLVFDGGSMFIDSDGIIGEELSYFKEDYKIVNWNIGQNYIDRSYHYKNEDIELIYHGLILGIKDYFHKSGFKKAILGLSGGVDSALVLVLAAKALGENNVLPVLMPSEFSSEHSVNDALALCDNLNIKSKTVPIKDLFNTFGESLSPHFENYKTDVTEENIQARIRGTLLMAMSNKFGYILLNTTNKSEAAVGYGTLYGDLCGGIAVLADVYKTQVYKICEYINNEKQIIPTHILTKAPSAELKPGQKDSDSLPDYALLDQILKLYIESQLGLNEIVNKGFSSEMVLKILKMVDRNEYKRYQFPPIIRVSNKAFGIGRQMPLVANFVY